MSLKAGWKSEVDGRLARDSGSRCVCHIKSTRYTPGFFQEAPYRLRPSIAIVWREQFGCSKI